MTASATKFEPGARVQYPQGTKAGIVYVSATYRGSTAFKDHFEAELELSPLDAAIHNDGQLEVSVDESVLLPAELIAESQQPNITVLSPSEDGIHQILRRRYAPGQLIELRVPGVTQGSKKVVLGGLYDNQEKLVADILQISSTTDAPAIYTGLHEIKDDKDHRGVVTNDYKAGRKAVGAADVSRYRWLLIDIDTIRGSVEERADKARAAELSKMSSTEEEKAAAREVLDAVVKYFMDLGYSGDIVDSGNSFHFLPRIDLPATPENEELVKKVLKSLDAKFSTERAHVDVGMYDRSRVCKLPGTLSRKGVVTEARPHRLSKILYTAVNTQSTPIEVLVQIAGLQEAPKPSAKVDVPSEEIQSSLDYMYGFLDKMDIQYGDEKDNGELLFVVHETVCPFPHETGGHHKGECHTGVNKKGELCFACKHNSCQEISWRKFRDEMERIRGEAYQAPSRLTLGGVSADAPSVEIATTMPRIGIATTPEEIQASKAMAEKAMAERASAAAAHVATWVDHFPGVGDLKQGGVNYLINNFMPEGLNILGSSTGQTKTWLALAISRALISKEDFLRCPLFSVPAIVPVLYLIPESADRSFRNRCELFGISHDKSLFRCRTISTGPTLFLDDPLVKEAVKNMKCAVFVDTMVRFSRAESENDAMENKRLVDEVGELRVLGAPVITFLHHAIKGLNKKNFTLDTVLRGSGDIGANADAVWGLLRDSKLYNHAKGPLELDVVCLKPRDMDPAPLPFRIAASRTKTKEDEVSPDGNLLIQKAKTVSYFNTTGNFKMVKAPGDDNADFDIGEESARFKKKQEKAEEQAININDFKEQKDKAVEIIARAYKEGRFISQKQLSDMLGLSKRLKTTLLTGAAGRPWSVVDGPRNGIYFLPAGIKELPEKNPEFKLDPLDPKKKRKMRKKMEKKLDPAQTIGAVELSEKENIS